MSTEVSTTIRATRERPHLAGSPRLVAEARDAAESDPDKITLHRNATIDKVEVTIEIKSGHPDALQLTDELREDVRDAILRFDDLIEKEAGDA